MSAEAAVDLRALVLRGVRLFNRGRYFAAQQEWEAAWRATEGEGRAFLEALVQLAGGLHLRTRRAGMRGAEHLIQQALATLEDYQPDAQGVDVAALVSEFGAYVEWVRGARRPHRILDALRIPRIRLEDG